MPGQNRIGFDDGGDFFQGLLAELLTNLSESSALGVGELYASFNLVAQDVIFGDEIVVSQAQLLIDGARDVSQQRFPIHESILHRHRCWDRLTMSPCGGEIKRRNLG
jgi:hypothetical protein